MLVLQDTSGRIYPADRCSWREPIVEPGAADDPNVINDPNARTDGYYIFDALFYDGVTATVDRLNGRAVTNVSGAGTPTAGGVVTLGQIGKSGRFFAISNQV